MMDVSMNQSSISILLILDIWVCCIIDSIKIMLPLNLSSTRLEGAAVKCECNDWNYSGSRASVQLEQSTCNAIYTFLITGKYNSV